MKSHLILCCFFFLFSNLSFSESNETETRFGYSGPFVEINQVDGISTKEFFEKYVKPKRALLLKGASKSSPANKLWSDEYLKTAAQGHEEYKIVVETVKKESRDQEILNLSLKEFLEVYRTKEIYMVNEVPPYLRKDVRLPQPLQCKQASTTLEETIMWFSSGGTKSVVHTDDYENILCMFDGTKEVILVDYYKYKNEVDVII
jgi:hypothetical protein